MFQCLFVVNCDLAHHLQVEQGSQLLMNCFMPPTHFPELKGANPILGRYFITKLFILTCAVELCIQV